ncbi:MAG TPA: UDP-N-acetylmuramate dehydrogenase [Candidatus Cybelea sp.]|nr:UDP-N-acetylmuramate dehydrogenase [Candidatus Cybelea sp.]
MMAAPIRRVRLVERLPKVRGRYQENVALSGVTWFRVGGLADVVFRPADADDLADFMKQRPVGVPLTVIGVGSNLLVRDGGIPGVTIRLGRGFAEVKPEGTIVAAGAGAPDINVALTCRDAGIAGLEFLRGIPGTIGGALRMNAGAYGSEIKDVLIDAEAVSVRGERRRFALKELGLSYRHCGLGEDWIFASARLQGRAGDPAEIGARMEEISQAREATQPVRTRTGGSTFANPSDPRAKGLKAWELIDRAGCRGLTLGGAQVSSLHCNFLINTGEATAEDLEALGEEVRRRVREQFGVELEWEIRRIGVKRDEAMS